MNVRHGALSCWLLAVVAVASCSKVSDKVSEKVSQKVTEKVLSSAMSQDGNNAKVALSEGSAKVTSTDAQGRTSVMEFGTAKISEAELGVPIYPGASADESGSMRTQTPTSVSLMVGFHSKDSVAKVTAYYRELLQSKSQGQQFVDNSSADGAMLMLADDKSHNMVQVAIGKEDAGTSISVTAIHESAK